MFNKYFSLKAYAMREVFHKRDDMLTLLNLLKGSDEGV
jgi:hypothetical protein